MPPYEKYKGGMIMKNKIWYNVLRMRARIKEALGFKLSPFEDFIIEIGLD